MISQTGSNLNKRGFARLLRQEEGFTLLETTVVIVIILVVLVGSVPYFGKFFGSMGLNSAARDVSSALKTARSYAIAQRAIHNVIFDTSVMPNRYYITDNEEPPKQVGRGYALPVGVTITKITFSADGNKYKASFKPDGSLSVTETTEISKSLWIRRANEPDYRTDPTNFKRITVDNITGRVKIDEEKPSSK